MTDRKIALARVFRAAFALCLIFVIAVTIWYFFSHRRPAPVEPTSIKGPIEAKVEKQEGIEHYDFKGERVIQAKAAKHYVGSDALYRLEGNVEIKEFKKGGGQERIIRGDKITYDKDWRQVILEGQASLRQDDVEVKAPALFYQKEPESLSTDRGAIFSSNRLSGRAKQLLYSFSEEFLRLEGEVEIQLRRGPESPDVLVLKTDVFIYSRPEKRGSATGGVTFSLGKNSGQSGSLEFRLTADEQKVEKIELKGGVNALLVAEAEVSKNEEDLLSAKARRREIEADEMSLTAFPDLPQMEFLEARGNCLMKSVAGSASLTELRSEDMKIVFDRGGGLSELRTWNQAKLLEKEKDGSLKRLLSGQEILIERQGETLGVRAGASEDARLDSLDTEITALEIRLFSRQEIIEAAEGVKTILKPQAEKAEAVGFFAREKPVFIKARTMRFEQKLERLFLRGDVRMWQDKNMILAQHVIIQKDTGEIMGEGEVRSVFSLQPKKKEDKEEKIELGSEKMSYDPEASLLTFDQKSWLKTKTARLNAGSLFVSLAEKSSDIQTIKARGKVIVADELREGQSEEALYDLEEETMVLTGSPVVTDKEKGAVRGDKLTFRLGDDRILVENKGKERSTTVIKREQ